MYLIFYRNFIKLKQATIYLYNSAIDYNMKKIAFVSVGLMWCALAFSQPAKESTDDSWKKIYRASATRINDLIHTKLDVKFDYDKSYLYGKEWVTLRATFLSNRFALPRCQRDGHQ